MATLSEMTLKEPPLTNTANGNTGPWVILVTLDI